MKINKIKLFRKKLKPWFKPFNKKAKAKTTPPVANLYSMTHTRLASHAERIGLGVCSMTDSYATDLAMHMMDSLYQFNLAYIKWKTPPEGANIKALQDELRRTRNELCDWLNRIAKHYMMTEKNYKLVLMEAGFEIKRGARQPIGRLDLPKKAVKQL